VEEARVDLSTGSRWQLLAMLTSSFLRAVVREAIGKVMVNGEVWCRKCGCIMKLRSGKYGEFYGCTGYPICKNTLSRKEGEE
jgi:ssDNA-binding Zn-finger/Zn-ribbon topoisomerase 1